MNNLINYITEALKIGSKSKVNQKGNFTDEELRSDYNEVAGAYTKAEKDEFKLKYGVNTNKIRDIQLVILDYLRDNRQNKKEFNRDDFTDMMRYDLPERYEKLEEYLDKEPIEFVEFLLKTYEDIIKHKHISLLNPRSIADKHTVKRYNYLKKYLENI